MSVKKCRKIEELRVFTNSTTDNFDVPMQTELCGNFFFSEIEKRDSRLLFLTHTSTADVEIFLSDG